MKSFIKTFYFINIFAIALGIFEAAVVIYIREIYYPEGFSFPLVPMSGHLVLTEFLREVASILILISIAIIAGRNIAQRFAYFIYTFAIWDLVYYLFLWLIVDWPQSLLTWDILFLIPVSWTGPVLAPVLTSLLMIALALVISKANYRLHHHFSIHRKEWLLLVSGALFIFISFIWDYSLYIMKYSSDSGIDFKSYSYEYTPEKFNWLAFGIGFLIIIYTIRIIFNRIKAIY